MGLALCCLYSPRIELLLQEKDHEAEGVIPLKGSLGQGGGWGTVLGKGCVGTEVVRMGCVWAHTEIC